MDDTEINRCVAKLLAYWPMPEQTQGEMLALNQVLERYDVQDFDRTLELLTEHGRQFRPAPGELMPLVREAHRWLNEPPAPPALEPGSRTATADHYATGLQNAVEALAESQRRRAAAAMGDQPAPAFVDDQYAIWDDPPPPSRDALYKCGTCQDTGFKELDSAGQTTVKPCPDCRPEQHALWARRGYNADWVGRPNKTQREQIIEQIAREKGHR